MMKKLILLVMLLGAVTAWGKEPDNDDILSKTTDTSSPYYYTALILRYNMGDETLTDKDYHYLYYGYAFQENYKPLESNPDMPRLYDLAARINPNDPEKMLLEDLVSAGMKALKKDPFSPKVLNLMAYAYGALGNEKEEKAYFNRMNGVIRAIVASGDGLTEKTPRHILMFDHAIDVMAAENLTYGKSRIVSRTVEFIPFHSPYIVMGKKRKGLYFNFERIYWNKPEGYTYERDRTWQFNNLKPRKYK